MPTKKDTEITEKSFNPSDHIESIKGKPYLPVAWRIVWFRTDHPDWSIETQITDNEAEKRATARAVIKDENNRLIATGHKTAKPRGMISDYVELAETGAIGRALAYCGYGTQFSPELEEDEVVDSPVTKVEPVKTYTAAPSGKQKMYFAVARTAGYEGDKAKEIAKTIFKAESFNDLNAEQLDQLIKKMVDKAKEKKIEETPSIPDDTLDLDGVLEQKL